MELLIRGRILNFNSLPASIDDADAYEYIEDGTLIIKDQKIIGMGCYEDLAKTYAHYTHIDHRPFLLLAGLIDLHNHFPQVEVIGSYGTQLLEWLNKYTFPAEAKFSDTEHSTRMAKVFLDMLLSNGTTTSVSFGSVHTNSVDALFREADKRNMCLVAGKVMMDRNAPESVLDTPERSYDETKYLIKKWHKLGRNYYAITPRFAITSSPEQLEVASSLVSESPDCYLQTHLSETREEIELTMSLYPKAINYLGIYDSYNLLGKKSLMGHSIYLSESELETMSERDCVAVHCPTSNMFLGSGLFDLEKFLKRNIRTGISTDVGGGTSFSMLASLDGAYKIQQFRNYSINPFFSFYWATLGNAVALGLQDEIGNLLPGRYADFIVLDPKAIPISKVRMENCSSLVEELFILQTLGDDRSVRAVYVSGNCVIDKGT